MRTYRELASRIADELFRDGGTETEAHRLALVDGNSKEMCGWGKLPATDRIEMVIENFFTHRKKGKL